MLDATASMKKHIEAVKLEMKTLLETLLKSYISIRVALILYRDYYEDFVVREACVFTWDMDKFLNALNAVKVAGGGDIPEAVYEGAFLALRQSWRLRDENVVKKIILIGDAPPHNKPRGKVKKSDVEDMARDKEIEINTILITSLPK